MKTLFFLSLIVVSLPLCSQTGTSPMGPPTMGIPTYPNSGFRKRTDDVTGSGMSDATHMSSDVDPSVPTRNPKMKGKQNQDEEMEVGPYENGKYQLEDQKMKEKKEEK